MSGPAGRRGLDGLVDDLLNTSAPLLKMRQSLAPRNWAAKLKLLAEAPELSPFRDLLVSLATNGFGQYEAINAFIKNAGKIPELACVTAMRRIEAAIPENSWSALVAALVVLKTWTANMGDALYRHQAGMPPQGWTLFPLVCARAALKAGAIDNTVNIVDEAIDVLNAARYRHVAGWQVTMDLYRSLAREAESRWRMAVDNLAADLQSACRIQEPNFNAEFAAMLWTLGMLPEAFVVRSAASPPPLGLCRQAVRISLHAIPNDALLQYVWLELKDRGPFNIRDHTAFFGLVNLNYPSSPMMLDDLMPEPPSRLYAQTLIAWMRGTLTEDLAGRFVSAFQPVQQLFPEGDWTMYARMYMLVWIVSKQFGHLKMTDAASEQKWLGGLTEKMSSLHRTMQTHPGWPQIYTRSTGPIFWLLESLAASNANAELLPALENFRAGTLTYLLLASPPRPSAAEAAAAADLLQKESALLKELKGCFFLLLYPVLPYSYQHYDVDLTDPVLSKGLDFQGAPDAYARTVKALSDLHESMKAAAPTYASKRLQPTACIDRLATALRAHRSSDSGARELH